MIRQVINIRGANSSGKTTLARTFLAAGTEQELGRFPDATGKSVAVRYYTKVIEELALPVFLIGTYDDSKYGGCDKIKSKDVVHAALTHAVRALPGHIMFEGFYVSKSWEPYAELRNRLVRERGAHDLGWLWALMDAPLELVYERAQQRAPDRTLDRKELAAVVRQMTNTRGKAKAAFPGDVLVLDPLRSPETLHAEMVARIAQREGTV